MIHKKIREDMVRAMKERKEVELLVLRSLLASFTNEAVAKGKKPEVELDDDEAISVIKRASKQRMDSIEQFKGGGRDDLAEKEEAELQIIKTYLPESLGRDEIEKIAKMKKEEMGLDDKTKMGILIGVVMKELAGKADGKDVKEVVESLF